METWMEIYSGTFVSEDRKKIEKALDILEKWAYSNNCRASKDSPLMQVIRILKGEENDQNQCSSSTGTV